MKKWLAAMLILMLLVQALPLSALAAAAVGAPLSEAELKAAYALTGKYNGAGVYHNGMGVSESMNARQLIDWLEEQLNGDLAAAADQLASAQVALEDARTDNPEAYKQLTGMSGFDDLTGRIVELAAELEDARQTLRFHRDRLQEQTVMVEEMGELLEAEGLYDFEVARCNARIRTAAAGIADIRQDILDNSETWTADIALWKSIVNGTYRGASDLDARVNGCIAAIYDTAPEPASVRSNVVVCGRDTRAGRLKGAGSVLANDGSVITVMDDKHVYLEFHDPDGKPLEGLKVSARDYVDPKESKTAPKPVEGTTGPTGYVAFEISKFTADKKTKAFTLHIEVDARDVEVNGTHYQSLCLPMEKVSRGVKHTTTLKVDDLKTPYVYEATFHGYDIMYSQRQILYSSLNDEDFEIAVKVAGVEAEPTLYYAEDDKGTNEKSAKGTKNEDGVWIFKDKWKQILRPDKAAKIYFRFEGKDEKVATKLKPIWSVMDSPTNLASVLKGINPGFGLSFKLPPIAEGLDKSSIGFSIGGLDNFMPQFCVDVWGTVYLSIGGIKNTWDGIKDKWKTNELEDWENLEIEYDSDSKIERFKTELGARYDYLKSRKYEGMAKGGWRIGLYGILTAKWNKDTDDSDRSNFSLTGSGGIAIAYFVDFTFMFTIPPGAGVPLYLCLTVEGGLTMGIELGFDWYLKWNGKIWAVEDWNFTFHDFTVTFALGLSITFGVGIKGMVSGWIKGSGSISFVLNVFRERPVAFNIDASASFSIGVSFLLFTVSATLVSKTWHLYPEDNAAYPLMAHYMNKIPANDGEEEQVHTLTMPQHYPELAPEATLLLAEQEEASGGVKVATLGNALYAFFLQEDKIHWVNVSSPDGVEGDLSDAIQEGQALYGGEYDVDGMTDYAFDVCPGQGTVQVPRHDLNCDDYLAVTGLCAGVYDDMGVPLPEAGNICVYTVFLWQDADTGALVGSMNGDEHQLGCFHAAWAGTDEDPVPYIPSEPVLQQAFYTAQYGERDGSTGWFQDNVGADVELARAWDEDTGDAHTFTRIRLTHSAYCPADLSETYAADKSRYSLGKVSDAVRPDEGIESGAGGDYARVFSRGLQDGSWFAVSRSKGGEGDDGAVEYYDPVMDAAGEGNWRSVVLDKGGISAFASAPLTLSDGSQAAMLFYTDNAGNEEDGNLYRLKGLYVHPKDKKASSGDTDLETTLTTYDITLPTASFKLITIRSVIYLYWLESGSQDEAQEKDTYRLYTSI
ncbi:MAG: hypothetical protein IJH38_05945, partial [Clostridia bacterium]|nr:hypothetical protein [Clostridia bacterium]